MPSLKADSIVKVDRFEVVRCSNGMTYQQLKLVINQQLIPYFSYSEKIYCVSDLFFIYATLASVMDSFLPRIALTMVSGKKKILLLKKTVTTLLTLHSKRNNRWKLIFLETPRLQDRIRR
ncbi:unnamed protein product [Brassica oleracea]